MFKCQNPISGRSHEYQLAIGYSILEIEYSMLAIPRRCRVSFNVRRVDYFNTTIKDQPGEGYKILDQLADLGLNMLAFTAVPVGPTRTQLTIFPDETAKMEAIGQSAGLTLEGPHPAILVQGDDRLGALVGIHEKLYEASVNVFAATAVTDGSGRYGYILYVRRQEYERAAAALGI